MERGRGGGMEEEREGRERKGGRRREGGRGKGGIMEGREGRRGGRKEELKLVIIKRERGNSLVLE